MHNNIPKKLSCVGAGGPPVAHGLYRVVSVCQKPIKTDREQFTNCYALTKLYRAWQQTDPLCTHAGPRTNITESYVTDVHALIGLSFGLDRGIRLFIAADGESPTSFCNHYNSTKAYWTI